MLKRFKRPALRASLAILMCFASLSTAKPVRAQKQYDPGASDTEIKIGNIAPYTGFARAYGAVGRAEAAYFRMINEQGGINGRKINFESTDSASQPRRALDLTREMVEQDHVLLMFSSIGTEPNLAVRSYLNDNKIPQLFVESSSAVFNDPSHYPWTMGFFATYRDEGAAYAKYILQTQPNARIAVLYADTDEGNEYVGGVHAGLGAKAATAIVKEMSYEAGSAISDSNTFASQLAELKNSGANVFLNLSVGPFAVRTIRAAYDIDWHPLQFIPNASLSTAAFLEPAGLNKAQGIIANARSKGWLRPEAGRDPAVREFLDWMSKYDSDANVRDQNTVAGYERAQVLVEVLRKCGDNLTRANIMKQATHLDMELGMLRPGIRIKTSPNDYQPIKQLYLIRFGGDDWAAMGSVISN